MADIIRPREAINYEVILIEDSVETLISKINRNNRLFAESGGGPMGRKGRQSEPGCRGGQGVPGKPGDPADYDLRGAIGVDCDDLDTSLVEDLILPITTDHTLLLSNLEDTDDGLRVREIGDGGLTSERISSVLKDYKLKVYNSNSSGKGKHIHLANSLAIQESNLYLCQSGFTFSVDWNGLNQEYLVISNEKNSSILGHLQGLDFRSDIFQIRKDEVSQKFILDSGTHENNFQGRLSVDELTANRLWSQPNRSGYQAVWQDTLVHGEEWEVVTASELGFTFAEYYKSGKVSKVTEQFWQFIDSDSIVRFKRMNNWVLVDFHLGLGRVKNNDLFNLHNFQLKVNKSIVGCKTEGWHPSTVLQDESTVVSDPLSTTAEHGFFRISPADFTNQGDTFVLTFRFLGGTRGPLFSSVEEKDGYWITGQVWATWEIEECAAVEILVAEACPEFEIITEGIGDDCPPSPPVLQSPTITQQSGECAPGAPMSNAPTVQKQLEPADGSNQFPEAIFNPVFHAIRLDDPSPCVLPTHEIWKLHPGHPNGWFTITRTLTYCGPLPPVHYYAGRFQVTRIITCPIPLFAVPYVIKDNQDYFFPRYEQKSPYLPDDPRYLAWTRTRHRPANPDGTVTPNPGDFFASL